MHPARIFGIHTTLSTVLVPLTAAVSFAQNPALAPTVNTTVTVPNDVLRNSSITIPAGVTVRFIAQTMGRPAVIVCDGDAVVHGTLSVSADSTSVIPAGMVMIGRGRGGSRCRSSSPAMSYYFPPQGGRHAGDYGTAIPFATDGGSPGGYLDEYSDQGQFPCAQFNGSFPGGQGGGTLALLAEGRIEISGNVTADGFHPGFGDAGGSGGSILLRGQTGVSILQGAGVTARGGTAHGVHPETIGSPGYIRVDAWGMPPIVQGTVDPAPTVVELPHLRVVNPPQIGTSCLLQVFAPQLSVTWLAVALQPGTGATPFGELGIAIGGAIGIGTAVISYQSPPDPRMNLHWSVPNAPNLVGLPVWIQGLTLGGHPTPFPPRLTNTVRVVIG